MKNYFTFCTLVAFLSIFSVGSTLANGHSANSNQASWLNQYEECFVVNHRESLINWMNWDISASSSMMMGCPSNIDVALGAGECGREVSFNFAFTDITVSNLTTNPNVNSSAITSTTYCSSGQTRYSRIFQHTGPTGHTDLVISSIHLGVFQSVNNPVVTFNFYTLSGSLLGTHSEIIPNISQGIHTISIPSSNVIKVPANSSYIMEVVTNAPHISVFKIGRNQYGNAPGFAEATIQAAACPSVLNNEIDPAWSGITPNSIVFGVTGIPEDYKYTNISNGYESGDYFPIGNHAMSYIVTDASGNTSPCVFNINVTGYANITGAIACNDLVQVSLGEDCETVVTPDMLLQGSEYGCYDKYTVQIIANNGANLGNTVTSANIGQTLKTQVIGPNGNSCWGEIKVEDKFGPDFECHDIYATCSTDLSPGSPLSTRVPVSARILDGTIPAATTSATSFTIPVANLDGTTITDLNVFLDISHNRLADLAANITSPDGVTVPLFLNLPCTSPNMMVTFDDQSTNGSVACVGADPAVSGDFKPFNPLSIFNGKPLNGDWVITVFDLATGEGGTVNHLDIVFSQAGGFIPFPTSNAVTFTHVVDNTYLVNGIDYCSAATLTYTDTVIEEDCESAYAKIIKRCWTGYDNKGNQGNTCCQTIYVYRNGLSTLEFPKNFDGLNGNPAPLSCLIYGDSIPPTSVTGLPSGDLCYNVEITEPTDVRIDICKNSYKLIRTHKVIEWCSGQVIVHNQIVKVADHAGPVLTCPADVTISTDEYACSATYIVPKPSIGAECSDILDYHLSYNPHNTLASDYIYENVNQLGGSIAGLPQGDSWIKWTVTDECGNSSECTFKVRVEDHVLPNPVCDQSTVAAITGNGKAVVNAETFDDGSVDNCGIVKYEARKMTDKCGFGTTNFTATVEFCCEEVNTSVMVEFRVTDRYGNSNTCMVEVKVQDKLPPYITKCPADITLDCQADYKDLKVTGEPEYKDNCTVISVKSQDDVKISQCGVGTVTRTWTIEDKQGYKNSCVQVITLIDKKPFNANEIVWPLNYETKKCYSKLEPKDLPVGYDKPTFGDDNCSLVAAHYKDQIFKLVDGACEKVIRTWTVIDWCTYNDANPTLGVGWYEHIQIIKLQNDIPPQFEFACVDRTVATFGNCEGPVDFTMTAVDDCPENNTNLVWQYELFTETGLTPFAIVNSNRLFRTMAIGKYKVRWTVEDRCGNRAYCTHVLNVIESKKPTPYCLSSITTAVMNSNGTVSIWAKDYNLGAFDNCTPTDSLIFTFYGARPVQTKLYEEHYFKGYGINATKAEYLAGTAQIWKPLTKTSGILFDCSDIPNGISQELQLPVSVTDLADNSDYCPVTFVLQDNSNICPNSTGNQILVSGRVSGLGNGVSGVDVTIESTSPEYPKVVKTDPAGSYEFSNLNINANYSVGMHNNSDILNGVSTLDLVLIQRHILGLATFDDPKNIIAADVDNSSKITATDLVGLRKVILGISNEFPNGQSSYRFVTSNHVFTNPSVPFPFTEKYSYNQLTTSKVNQDFTVIKIGDVNGSATYNVNNPITESRSTKTLTIETDLVDAKLGQEIKVPVFAHGFNQLFGYQFTMNFDQSALELKEIASGELTVSDQNFGLHKTNEGIITTSWNADQPMDVEDGSVMFYMTFIAKKDLHQVGPFKVNSDITPALAFDVDQNVVNIKTHLRNTESIAGFELMQNKPNPFHNLTNIHFRLPEAGNVKLTISDITGKVLKTIQGNYPKGEHSIEITKSDIGASGVLMYQLESGRFIDTKKMIVIE